MADTGAKAGQQIEFAARLVVNGAVASYANKTAFEAASWALYYRAAQVDVTPTYTVQPWSDMGDGWHLFVLTTVNGAGPVGLSKPTGGEVTDYAAEVQTETHDIDDIYALQSAQIGVPSSVSRTTKVLFEVTEGDSFAETITVRQALLAQYGYDSDDLEDGTLTVSGAVRKSDNRSGVPNAWLGILPITYAAGSDATLQIGWGEYPVAQSGVIDGMSLASGDADDGPTTFLADVQAKRSETIAIATADATANTFTLSGDYRKWIPTGGTFLVNGSTGNDNGDADYVSTDTSYDSGSNVTTITVANVADDTDDGNILVDITITLAKVTLKVVRQEDLS